MKIITFELKVAVGDKIGAEEVKSVIEQLTKSPMTQNLCFIRSRYVDGIKDPGTENGADLKTWLERAKEEIK